MFWIGFVPRKLKKKISNLSFDFNQFVPVKIFGDREIQFLQTDNGETGFFQSENGDYNS